MSEPPRPDASGIPPFPTRGRCFRLTRLVAPRDASPTGRARLDAIVDWLQHVAYADVVDAGIAGDAAWVVRRTTLRVERFPVVGESVELATACSGHGMFYAERRTRVRGSDGGAVEAATIWVALDPTTLRPMRPARFLDVYGPSAGDRRVRAKLHHPPPPPDATATPWQLRAADIDAAGHVNNAAYWQALEERWSDLPAPGLVAEAEHHVPARAGAATLLLGDRRAWLCGPGEVLHASFALRWEDDAQRRADADADADADAGAGAGAGPGPLG